MPKINKVINYQEKNLYTIDSFINVPLDIIAAVSIVLFMIMQGIILRAKDESLEEEEEDFEDDEEE